MMHQPLRMMPLVLVFIWMQAVRCGFDHSTAFKPSTEVIPTDACHTVLELEHEQRSHGASSSASPFPVILNHGHHGEPRPPPTLNLFPRQPVKPRLDSPLFGLYSWSPPPAEIANPNLNQKVLSPSSKQRAPQTIGTSSGASEDYPGERTPLPTFNLFPLQQDKLDLNVSPISHPSRSPFPSEVQKPKSNLKNFLPSLEESTAKTISVDSEDRQTGRRKRPREDFTFLEPQKKRQVFDVPLRTLDTASSASESRSRPRSRSVTPNVCRELPVEIRLHETDSKSRGSQLNGFDHSSILTASQIASSEPRLQTGQSIVGDLPIQRTGKASDANGELTRDQTEENIVTASAGRQSEHVSENMNLEDATSLKDLAFQYYSHQTWFEAPHPLCPKAALLSTIVAEYLLSKVPNKQASKMLEMMHQSDKILLPFIYQLNRKGFLRQRWARISHLWEKFWSLYEETLGNNPKELLRRFVWITDYVYEITIPKLSNLAQGNLMSPAASIKKAQARMIKDISLSNIRIYRMNTQTYAKGAAEILRIYLKEPSTVNFQRLSAQSSDTLHKFVLGIISRNAYLINSCLAINVGTVFRNYLWNLFDKKSNALNTAFNQIANDSDLLELMERIFAGGDEEKILEILQKNSEVIGRLQSAPFRPSCIPDDILYHFEHFFKGEDQSSLPQKINGLFSNYQISEG